MFEFLDFIYGWITTGIYAFAKDAFSWMIQKMLIGYYESVKWSIEFAWDIAQDVLNELNISNQIMSAFNALPGTTKQVMVFFRIPEFLNLILSAFTTRLILKFVPFL